jgi:hypothetical protein
LNIGAATVSPPPPPRPRHDDVTENTPARSTIAMSETQFLLHGFFLIFQTLSRQMAGHANSSSFGSSAILFF